MLLIVSRDDFGNIERYRTPNGDFKPGLRFEFKEFGISRHLTVEEVKQKEKGTGDRITYKSVILGKNFEVRKHPKGSGKVRGRLQKMFQAPGNFHIRQD